MILVPVAERQDAWGRYILEDIEKIRFSVIFL